MIFKSCACVPKQSPHNTTNNNVLYKCFIFDSDTFFGFGKNNQICLLLHLLLTITNMKRTYSKSCSIALIAAIYLLGSVAGIFLFFRLTAVAAPPLWALLYADVLTTIVIWLFGLLYENVSVYDPYWSVFPPVAFLLWHFTPIRGRCRSSLCWWPRGTGAGDSPAIGPSPSKASPTKTGAIPNTAVCIPPSSTLSISSV